jgi:glycosyltransferase involved in cell wall biosynthesis
MSSTALVPAYACVIATRNRINAIRMSIPLILKQDAPPARLIVVDSSADHDSVRTEVNEISERFGFENTVVVKSDTANLARQRNIGLQFVQAPVVMFPDDDSMWHAGFASSVLKIYQSDMRGQVGGVAGVGVLGPPPELGRPSYGNEATIMVMGFAPSPIASMFARRRLMTTLKFFVLWNDT